MPKDYEAYQTKTDYGIEKGDKVTIISQARTPNGPIRFEFAKDDRTEEMAASDFYGTFRLKEAPKVELVIAEGHELRSDRSLVITVDPQWACMIDDIAESIKSLVGHERVVVHPLPKDAIRFYQVEHPSMMAVDPAFLGGDYSVDVDIEQNVSLCNDPMLVDQCSGCTDRNSEGTHQGCTEQHGHVGCHRA